MLIIYYNLLIFTCAYIYDIGPFFACSIYTFNKLINYFNITHKNTFWVLRLTFMTMYQLKRTFMVNDY